MVVPVQPEVLRRRVLRRLDAPAGPVPSFRDRPGLARRHPQGRGHLLENGIYIEYGPYKHAINQTFFLYVWEPGGNRIEFATAQGRLILDPDWPVVEWSQAERAKGQAWGMKTVPTFHTHGTPFVEDQEEIDRAALEGRPYVKRS